MIKSSEEFFYLRNSDDLNEQFRASNDSATIEVWLDILFDYPEYKKWVIQNKTIQIEILEFLSKDNDAEVRCEVARKRKINDTIFQLLSTDKNENVRFALMNNTKLSLEKKNEIFVEDSQWLKSELDKINNDNK